MAGGLKTKKAFERAVWDVHNSLDATQFIASDPIQFVHRFLPHDKASAEWVAWLAALMAYGNRKAMFTAIEALLAPLGSNVANAIASTPHQDWQTAYSGFVYRFYKGPDAVWLLQRCQWVAQTYGSLGALFTCCPKEVAQQGLQAHLAWFTQAFVGVPPVRYGSKYWVPTAATGGACKRLLMFLRWVVRHDEVDTGLWKEYIDPKHLLVPLDVHLVRAASHYGLSQGSVLNWKQAQTITGHLSRLSPNDPLLLERALFVLGQQL